VRRAVLTLALAALVVSAGCSFDTTPRANDPGTPTVTPAPLPPTASPTDSPTPEPPRIEQHHPYVSDHLDALAGEAFTVTETFEVRFANGTVYHAREMAAAVAADRDVYRYRSEAQALAPDSPLREGRSSRYSNGTLVAYRTETAESEELGVVTAGDVAVEPSDVYVGTPRNEARLDYLLRSLTNVTVSGGEADYRIEATGFVRRVAVVDGVTVRNVTVESFEAEAEDDLVERWELVLRGTVDGKRVRAVERVVYVEVGPTRVREPEWFDEAVSSERGVADRREATEANGAHTKVGTP
jgi:hypothetical protein